MASQTQGIHQLRCAEKSAELKVSDARIRRIKRLKQATEEAQMEIDRFRTERDLHFKEFEAKHLGSRASVFAKLDSDIQIKLNELNRSIEANRDKVIDAILEFVYDITPEVNRNLRFKRYDNVEEAISREILKYHDDLKKVSSKMGAKRVDNLEEVASHESVKAVENVDSAENLSRVPSKLDTVE